MKLFPFLTLFLLFSLTSCLQTDDVVTEPTTNTITYRLQNVSGGPEEINQNIASGQITWTFNTSTHLLTTINNSTDPLLIDYYPTGSYDYSLIEENGELDLYPLMILIDGESAGYVSSTPSLLIVAEDDAQGFKYKFVP